MASSAACLCVSAEVRAALEAAAPVVALESTILAHGFPETERYPLATQLEEAVRSSGATPATVAVIDGTLHVGLDDAQLRIMTGSREIAKTAALDLAVYLARGATAATTVSATLHACVRAGVRVFATGGIGGVHRGDAGDVSSDLRSLAESQVVVVSAGAKAILDLSRTLEMLETLGVLVLGYQTHEFPAFYYADSGVPVRHRIDDAETLATIARVRFDELGQGGILVCRPLEASAALVREDVESAIDAAIAKAVAASIHGSELTPFLLAELASTSEGQTVEANRALALGNARLASEIAVAYAASR